MRDFNYSKIKEQKWDSEVLSLIAAIYKYAGKQELYLKQRPDELEKLVEIAKIQSTESSNAIEGIVTTNTRIKQLVEESTTPKNRDEEEIAGYRDVLNIIHESFDAIPITKNYILQLHKILYSHMNNPIAGQTKTVQNYISATYPDGHTEVFFTPMAPFETPKALEKICEEYNRVIGNLEVEPLIAIPVFIHDFLCIHPFNDGNGRMARLWQNILLYNWKEIFEYLPTESFIHEYQNAYYNVIHKCNINGDITEFIKFILNIIEETLDKMSNEFNMELNQKDININKLLSCLEKGVHLSANDIINKLNIKSKDTLRNKYLYPAIKRSLVKLTILEKPNSSKQTYNKV